MFKTFDAVAASTGLSEKAAREAGFDVGAAIGYKDNHASYYPGGKEFVLKLVYDRSTSRLLGAQVFGTGGRGKAHRCPRDGPPRGDVPGRPRRARPRLRPTVSSANDPANVAAFVAQNDVSGYSPLETAAQLRSALAAAEAGGPPALVLDVRNVGEYEQGHVPGSLNLPLDELRFRLGEVPRDRPISTCIAARASAPTSR